MRDIRPVFGNQNAGLCDIVPCAAVLHSKIAKSLCAAHFAPHKKGTNMNKSRKPKLYLLRRLLKKLLPFPSVQKIGVRNPL